MSVPDSQGEVALADSPVRSNAVPTAHLIDASIYIFRAWHSMPAEFADVDGAPINAVHGVTRFLCDFLERA